ncbi:MAG TPA: hypothetical protein PKY82_32510, partial [Pyrinomonadaceae bacterium]|nr:hypothetical protein [Pyrinomonadaceae bacterium]
EEEREPADIDDEMGGQPNQRRAAVAIPEFQGIRVDDFTYIEYETGEKELYDLKKDPDQLKNIASTADSAWLKKLAEHLQELRGCTGENCRKIEDKSITP